MRWVTEIIESREAEKLRIDCLVYYSEEYNVEIPLCFDSFPEQKHFAVMEEWSSSDIGFVLYDLENEKYGMIIP